MANFKIPAIAAPAAETGGGGGVTEIYLEDDVPMLGSSYEVALIAGPFPAGAHVFDFRYYFDRDYQAVSNSIRIAVTDASGQLRTDLTPNTSFVTYNKHGDTQWRTEPNNSSEPYIDHNSSHSYSLTDSKGSRIEGHGYIESDGTYYFALLGKDGANARKGSFIKYKPL